MENKKPRPSEKGLGAIISVRFSRDDLDQVLVAAKREGMNTSEFIRRATLGGVARQGRQGSIMGVSGRGGFRGVGEDTTVSWKGVRAVERTESKEVSVLMNETN